jgi:GNAT superfamily N-acetyltransferase
MTTTCADPTVCDGDLVRLRNDVRIVIRPVRASDIALLLDGFARLSDAARRNRFLAHKRELSAAEALYFTDVDHHDHEALAALDPITGRGVGSARFVRRADRPHAADVAVTVVDGWQRRGVASALLARLVERAAEEGITTFTADIAADNKAVLDLIDASAATARVVSSDGGTLLMEIAAN